MWVIFWNKIVDVMSNIASTLKAAARKRPHEPALVAGKDVFTFTRIEADTAAYADFLRQAGIEKGERVMLMVRPSKEFVCLAFALFAVGAVVILIDPGMGYKNLLRCIGSVRPEALLGIPRAILFKKIFPKPFATVRRTVCVGRAFGLLGAELPDTVENQGGELVMTETGPDDLAAIIFTTGSTGPPKGVRYEHRIFSAQLKRIRDYYQIGPGDVDQPAFPLFALFSIALGACAVIPDMDPTRPAEVNPEKFIATIDRHQVTYSFGSPAIWNVVGSYCRRKKIVLPSLKKVLMAGAPVSGELVERMQGVLADDAEIHTPYGATECLPIVSITGSEIVRSTWPLTRKGRGTCVGRPLPDTEIRVMAPVDGPVADISHARFLPEGEIGEIIVKGEVVTRAYENNEAENRISKIGDNGSFWHRIGDTGYLDGEGRLWFCGRKAHRVLTAAGPMYSVCCEAVFNEHPMVFRSALVGIGPAGSQQPVIVVELAGGRKKTPENLFAELRAIAVQYRHTKEIKRFLVHPSFPVDIRHNAKIFREKLAEWAAERV